MLSPLYWPTWLGTGLMRLVALCPYPLQCRLGRALGRLLRIVALKKIHVARVNLALCFPEWSEQERESVLDSHFLSLGRGLIELAASWYSRPQLLEPIIRLEGESHLQQALADGRGALLLGFHLTHLEIGGCMLARQVGMSAMYRRAKNPVIQAAMVRGRLRHLDRVFASTEVRSVIRSLKANNAIWYATDQDFRDERSDFFVPFFGVPAATSAAAIRLARVSNAPVLPLTQRRASDDHGIVITVHPPLEDFSNQDDKAGAEIIHRFLEDYLRKRPEDYMWTHRRFYTRPPGEPFVYRKSKDPRFVSPRRYEIIVSRGKVIESQGSQPGTVLFPDRLVYKLVPRPGNALQRLFEAPHDDYLKRLSDRVPDLTLPTLISSRYCPSQRCQVLVFKVGENVDWSALLDDPDLAERHELMK